MLVSIYEGGLLYSDKVKREVDRTNNNMTNMAAYQLLDWIGHWFRLVLNGLRINP